MKDLVGNLRTRQDLSNVYLQSGKTPEKESIPNMSMTEKSHVDHGVDSDHGHHEVAAMADKDAGVAIATTLDNANAIPNAWGSGHVRLYMICFIVYFCSTMGGKLKQDFAEAATDRVG
jgi:hypothetical protein